MQIEHKCSFWRSFFWFEKQQQQSKLQFLSLSSQENKNRQHLVSHLQSLFFLSPDKQAPIITITTIIITAMNSIMRKIYKKVRKQLPHFSPQVFVMFLTMVYPWWPQWGQARMQEVWGNLLKSEISSTSAPVNSNSSSSPFKWLLISMLLSH